MLYSSLRKQALVGWAYKNAYPMSNMQLHKFLFFYELFSKIDDDTYELEGLKGYVNGPVFSAVFGDERYIGTFRSDCGRAFSSFNEHINDARARLSVFLVKSLGDKLSEFTHRLDIWAVKRDEISRGNRNVPLYESDFSGRDDSVLREIKQAYPDDYVRNVDIINILGKSFVYYKDDAERLTHRVHDTLCEAASNPEFDSPVYISFSDEGDLLLD